MITTSIKTRDYDYLIKVLAVWWRGHLRPVTAPSECDSNQNGVYRTPTEQLALVHLHPLVVQTNLRQGPRPLPRIPI